MSLAPGTTIERYVVQSLLGQGGMAAVYMVRHTQLETLHALKVLAVGSEHIRERLLVEGRVQARLRHPHIVAVSDVLEVAGQPSLLMEYIAGPALDRWMMEHKPTLDEALAVFRGVLAGIAHAHAKGLIHRDLKPGNVLLQVEEGEVVPKVTDFGLVKALDAAGSASPLSNPTRTGATMGTPAYMSPEQIRDASSVDSRADIFSLGCMLYELVCDRPAFVGSDVLELFNKVANADFPPPREVAPDLPDAVVRAIEGMLVVERDARLHSCEAVLAVLGEGPTTLVDGEGAAIARQLKTSLPLEIAAEADSETWHGTLPDAPPPTESPTSDNRAVYGALVIFALALITLAVVVLRLPSTGGPTASDPGPSLTAPAPVAPSDPGLAAPAPVAAPDPGLAAPAPVAAPKPEPVAAPAPTASPRPVARPAPEPAPEPAAEPEPIAPAAPTPAKVSFEGAGVVELLGEDGQVHALPGAVPPGTYRIRAIFGGTPASAGHITLAAGETAVIGCVAGFAQCRKK